MNITNKSQSRKRKQPPPELSRVGIYAIVDQITFLYMETNKKMSEFFFSATKKSRVGIYAIVDPITFLYMETNKVLSGVLFFEGTHDASQIQGGAKIENVYAAVPCPPPHVNEYNTPIRGYMLPFAAAIFRLPSILRGSSTFPSIPARHLLDLALPRNSPRHRWLPGVASFLVAPDPTTSDCHERGLVCGLASCGWA